MSFRSLFTRNIKSTRRPAARLRLLELEAREVPSVTIADLPNQELFIDRPLFLPVTVTNTPNGPVTVTASSNTAQLKAEVVTGGRTLVLTVSGTDNLNVAFTGTLTLRLFEDVAPLATKTIIDLVNSGFYNNKLFHRIIDGFIIQGGSPLGDGIGGSTLPDVSDEFNKDYTFASSGLLAMANAGDDNNNSQFFITDIDQSITSRPNHLNFNHSIVGILTGGFDTFQKIITTPVSGSTPTHSVTITGASIITDTSNAVIKLSPQAGFSGTANITISAKDNDNMPVLDTLTLTGVTDPNNDNPFLGPISNVSTSTNAPVTINLTSTDLQNDAVTYGLTATTNASNVTINLNTATGVATVTPAAGFTGVVNLTASVKDAGNSPDTQKFTMTVTAATTATTTVVTLSTGTAAAAVGNSLALIATVSGVGTAKGTIEFFSNGVSKGIANVYDNHAAILYTPNAAGTESITAVFTSSTANVTGSTAPGVNLVSTTSAIVLRQLFNVAGSAVGQTARVTATASSGSDIDVTPFGSFTGGVAIAVADVNDDGQDDIVAVPGLGGGSIVIVINGVDGSILKQRIMFEDTFRGGLTLDVGDFAGKGYAQVVVGAGNTGGPRVTVWDFKLDQLVYNYFAYDQVFRGGVQVDAADLRSNGFALIVTGAGVGAGPIVAIFDGLKAAVNQAPTEYGRRFPDAASQSNRDGIKVSEGLPRADRTKLINVVSLNGINLADIDLFTSGGIFGS